MIDSVKDLGPLGDVLPVFALESLYGCTKRQVKNGFGVLEQVQSKSSYLIYTNLNKEGALRLSFKTNGKPYQFRERVCYKSIIKDDVKFSAFFTCKSSSKDFYVQLSDERYFRINYFFKDRQIDKVFFNCNEIKCLGFFDFNFLGKRLLLKHIIKAKLTKNVLDLPVNLINNKITFIDKFSHKSSNYVNNDEGFVIKTIFKFHN